jgi:hypothetical protein
MAEELDPVHDVVRELGRGPVRDARPVMQARLPEPVIAVLPRRQASARDVRFSSDVSDRTTLAALDQAQASIQAYPFLTPSPASPTS